MLECEKQKPTGSRKGRKVKRKSSNSIPTGSKQDIFVPVSQKNTHSLKKKPTILIEKSKNWVEEIIQNRITNLKNQRKMLDLFCHKYHLSCKRLTIASSKTNSLFGENIRFRVERK